MMTFPAANAIYRRETYDNYPAARAILQVVYEGLQVPFDTALRVESRWFAKILRSPEAAAMIRSLFVSMQDLNKGARRPAERAADEPEENRRGRRRLHGRRHRAGERGGGPAGGADRPRSGNRRQGQGRLAQGAQRSRHEGPHERRRARRVAGTDYADADYGALKDCDLVIEAVFEDRKVKSDVIAKIQAVIGDKAIFASNTSTLPITSLASEFKDPARFIGIHFFSPVDRMMLVEIILGKQTGDKALAAALDYVRAIRKTPIVVNDSRGFYTSRVVGTYIREGHLMLTEGMPAAMIENVGRMAGMPVGPLSLNDEVAVDLGLENPARPPRPISAPKAIDPRQKKLLEEMVEKHGRFGRKNGKGFYDYPANGAEEIVARPCRPAAEEAARSGKDRHRGIEAAPARHAGAGNGALLRGESAHRRARGRCRLDPRLRLCAVLRRHAVVDRHDGDANASSICAASWKRNTARALRPTSCCIDLAEHDERFYQRFAPAKRKEAA